VAPSAGSDTTRSDSSATFLIGGILLVLGLILFVTLAPVIACPECEGGAVGVVTKVVTPEGTKVAGCTRCASKGKLSILKRWMPRLTGSDP
jgi:hypothetical protein